MPLIVPACTLFGGREIHTQAVNESMHIIITDLWAAAYQVMFWTGISSAFCSETMHMFHDGRYCLVGFRKVYLREWALFSFLTVFFHHQTYRYTALQTSEIKAYIRYWDIRCELSTLEILCSDQESAPRLAASYVDFHNNQFVSVLTTSSDAAIKLIKDN
jgi:hypothetical protein